MKLRDVCYLIPTIMLLKIIIRFSIDTWSTLALLKRDYCTALHVEASYDDDDDERNLIRIIFVFTYFFS